MKGSLKGFGEHGLFRAVWEETFLYIVDLAKRQL
jgi:hypothetical protein